MRTANGRQRRMYFFVPPAQIKEQKVTVTGPDAVHITRVLRLRPGDEFTVSDGRGKGYRVRLSKTGSREIEGIIEAEFSLAAEPPFSLTLVQGVPKGEKMELIIQKSTELGVKEIIPLLAERSIVKLAGEKLAQRRLRWQRVAYEAAKQCRRGAVPAVGTPLSLAEVFRRMPSGAVGIMPWEEERETSFRQVLLPLKEALPEAGFFLFIGPEGGFTLREAALAKENGVVTVSLGRRILRTETAALTAAAIILYELGDLGG